MLSWNLTWMGHKRLQTKTAKIRLDRFFHSSTYTGATQSHLQVLTLDKWRYHNFEIRSNCIPLIHMSSQRQLGSLWNDVVTKGNQRCYKTSVLWWLSLNEHEPQGDLRGSVKSVLSGRASFLNDAFVNLDNKIAWSTLQNGIMVVKECY